MDDIKFSTGIEVAIVQSMGGDETIAMAAMVSTSGAIKESVSPEKVKGLIGSLLRQKHGTPFEHSAITFFVRAPIFVWREWHRHRIGMSYNEQSARYSKLDAEFWLPPEGRKMIPVDGYKAMRPVFQAATEGEYNYVRSAMMKSYHASYEEYENLIKYGIAKEVARAVLPVGIYSSCWVTCNPRSLMHFLSLRVHDPLAAHPSFPQAEIEVAAKACEEIFKLGWPITHAAFVSNARVAP